MASSISQKGSGFRVDLDLYQRVRIAQPDNLNERRGGNVRPPEVSELLYALALKSFHVGNVALNTHDAGRRGANCCKRSADVLERCTDLAGHIGGDLLAI